MSSLTSHTVTGLEDLLTGADDARWQAAAGEVASEIHPVDRAALRVWLAFFPQALSRLVREAGDAAAFERKFLLAGRYRLSDQIDTSHCFLYGHRHWAAVKRAIVMLAAEGEPGARSIPALVRRVAADAATAERVDRALVTAIALVGLSTLQQVGRAAFAATPGVTDARDRSTPDEIVRARARDDSQGMFGFLRGEWRRWTVTFDEGDPDARFPLVNSQAITTAAAADTRDWRARDPRCTEGPIPVQCRSASCGTCWIGVLGGVDKLSVIEPRERTRLREFGYSDSGDSHPVIRLACQARASGAVSIVIPPWNGVFGKALSRPATPAR
jgi:ferredoxin